MTSLDDYWPPVEPREAPETPRKHRHIWYRTVEAGETSWVCLAHSEPVIRDIVKARRGKSSRRLGADQERRIERVYGPVKIGERGDPVDHIGRVWRWQSKATRSVPPQWLAAIREPEWTQLVPAWAVAPYNAMAGLYSRKSVLIRSFVSRGIRTRDWLIVSSIDGTVELGLPGPDHGDPRGGWWVIPGEWWLDHFGRDE